MDETEKQIWTSAFGARWASTQDDQVSMVAAYEAVEAYRTMHFKQTRSQLFMEAYSMLQQVRGR